ncbi:MAG: hypothetical protein WCI45_07875 [Desulfuromonadales bacterium]
MEQVLDIGKARVLWSEAIKGKGAICPCCDKFGKVYKQKIGSGNAGALIWMVRNTDPAKPWIDMRTQPPRWITQKTTFTLLRWWGLIEGYVNVREIIDPETKEMEMRTTKNSGLWKVTPAGFDFVHRRIQVPKYVYLYNDTLQNVGTKTCTIDECLTEKFNYDRLMNDDNPQEFLNEYR